MDPNTSYWKTDQHLREQDPEGGAKRKGDQCRIRCNHELYEIFDNPEVWRLRNLQWIGYAQHMDDARMTKKVFKLRTEG